MGTVVVIAYHAATNENDTGVQDGEGNLAWRGEPLSLVDVEPVNTTKAV